jgi:hypothetical protein
MNTTNPLAIKANDVHHELDKHLSYLSDLSPREIKHRIRTYRKFIFVREPFERLLSAYRNKFAGKGATYFHMAYGRRIIKRYREHPSNESLASGNDVTFPEFVQYMVSPDIGAPLQGYNEHWAHYYTLCHPCTISYDFVGKYETLDNDIDHILKMLSLDNVVKFPKRSATYKQTKTSDMMAEYYSRIPVDDLRKLWRIFLPDYVLFDYPFPPVMQRVISADKK